MCSVSAFVERKQYDETFDLHRMPGSFDPNAYNVVSAKLIVGENELYAIDVVNSTDKIFDKFPFPFRTFIRSEEVKVIEIMDELLDGARTFDYLDRILEIVRRDISAMDCLFYVRNEKASYIFEGRDLDMERAFYSIEELLQPLTFRSRHKLTYSASKPAPNNAVIVKSKPRTKRCMIL